MKRPLPRFALVVPLFLAALAAFAVPGQKVLEKFSQGSAAAYSSLAEVKPYYEVRTGYPAPSADALPEIRFDHSRARTSSGGASSLLVTRPDDAATALRWPTGLAWVEWDIQVPREGLYELEIEYRAEPGTTSRDIERSLFLDGTLPFTEAGNVILQRLWRETGDVKINYAGDEVWPEMVEVIRWNRIVVYDKSALYVDPLRFHLSAGRHTIRLGFISETVTLGEIAFRPIRTYPSYAEYAAQHQGVAAYRGEVIRFEAEGHVVEMNNAMVRRESEIDPAVSPRSLGARKLNVLGGWRWREGNQSVSWGFTVPEDGLYAVGFKVLLWTEGLPVYRRIEIDGEVPFAEFASYPFRYDKWWQMAMLGDGDTDYLLHLTRGEHTITMTVTTGAIGELSLSLQKDTAVLSSLLADVFKLAGSEPDPNFDYEFEKNIPGMMGQLQQTIAHLDDDLATLDRICTQRPEVSSLIGSVKDTIELFVSDHYKMSSRLKDLRQTQGSLTSIYFDLLYSTTLAVDYVLVGAKEPGWFRGINSNFIQRVYTTLYNFVRSFTHDYNAVSGMLSGTDSRYKALNVWMGQGMEWAEVLKGIADERFTPKTGIVLNINLVPASSFQAVQGGYNVLLLSLAAGKAPDVATEVLSTIPVEFAIRDSAVDLGQFEDYDEVAARFLPECSVPFRYRGGTYGLPQSMTMKLLFYRKDILEELGLRVPDTWDELCEEVLPVLYRNNLAFSFPPDYSIFLYQNGGKFYSDDGMTSALDSEEAFKAFRDFLFMYTGYGVDAVSSSFYQKFRTGEIPMGIGDHATYLQFLCAAPEIAGKWAIASLPGVRRADGTIDRSSGSQVLGQKSSQVFGLVEYGAMIFKSPKTDVQSAWEYLKWLTSYETQVRFCYGIEASMTTFSRWFTSNTEAYKDIAWIPEHLGVLIDQWKWRREIPVVLGGYFLTRHLNNAWTDVYTLNKEPRDALELAVKEINLEMQRKQVEYGINAGK